jgi:DNA-binding CsgD family transcriptional regulator
VTRDVLTDRQAQVMDLILEGLIPKEIAVRLRPRISERQVKKHLYSARDALGCATVPAAAARWQQLRSRRARRRRRTRRWGWRDRPTSSRGRAPRPHRRGGGPAARREPGADVDVGEIRRDRGHGSKPRWLEASKRWQARYTRPDGIRKGVYSTIPGPKGARECERKRDAAIEAAAAGSTRP